MDPDGRYDCEEIEQEIYTETRRTFNGDFGQDFFLLSMQEYNNGEYLRGFAHSLDGTAEFFFDFFCVDKIANGLGKLAKKAEETFSSIGCFNSNAAATPLLSETASSTKLSQNLINSGVSKSFQTAAHQISQLMML